MTFERLKKSGVEIAAVVLASIALFLHARKFDFICDDAFITLRYAQNFAKFGEPVYNRGEFVEGYTHVSWFFLESVFLRAGLTFSQAFLALGALSSALVMAGVAFLWRRTTAGPAWTIAVPLGLVAACVPLAVWTLGGMETGLYTALIVLSVGLAAQVATTAHARVAIAWGLVQAAVALTRPEGLILFVLTAAVVWFFTRKRRVLWLAFGAFCVLFVPFLIWRVSTYGGVLPNTFYVKTAGSMGETIPRGLRYLWLFAKDVGFFGAVSLMSLLVPFSYLRGPEGNRTSFRLAVIWIVRVHVVFTLPYVAFVGGDFLGLYRFLVPVYVLGLVLLAIQVSSAWTNYGDKEKLVRIWLLSTLGIVGVAYLRHAYLWGVVALHRIDPEEQAAHIEAVHWTKRYAKRWAAMGRWIKRHSKEGDWMTVGAAGAMPYYAELPNLDLLGLCDAYVAHNGEKVSSRPGHQIRAPLDYVMSKSPVFLFYNDEDSDESDKLDFDNDWDARGYVWVEARITERDGAQKEFYHRFLLRKDRAQELVNDDSLRFRWQ